MKKQTICATLTLCSLVPIPTSVRADDDHGDRDKHLIVGTVNPDGTSQTPTTKFTITHPSPGRYVITFAPHVFGKDIPACIVMPLGSLTVAGILENVSFCDFTIVDLGGMPTDAFHNFFAAGITH